MWHIAWVAIGLLLVGQHVLVYYQAHQAVMRGDETRDQRIARFAVLITLLWILTTLLSHLLNWM
ncbi:hypothetical protein HYR53_10570 [Candidatus Acetothermia bacterium]|nr:hypothetical protein [Candidatus Acetothermia bacterium]